MFPNSPGAHSDISLRSTRTTVKHDTNIWLVIVQYLRQQQLQDAMEERP